jgi:GH15 family glucan-1,4-alpha-glucosidase
VVIAALETAIRLADVAKHPEDGAHWQKAAEHMREGLQALYQPEGSYFRRGFLLQEDGSLQYDDILDISSLYGPFMYANLPLDDPRLQGTLEAVKNRLWNQSPVGGVVRDEHDGYFLSKQQYKGNPWIVCTLWLAQYYNALGDAKQAGELLDWAEARALRSGTLSEQFDPETGDAIGVTPLVWSHAEFINTALDIAKID